MDRASVFFANAERDLDAERRDAITWIQAQMQIYGLTIADIQP